MDCEETENIKKNLDASQYAIKQMNVVILFTVQLVE